MRGRNIFFKLACVVFLMGCVSCMRGPSDEQAASAGSSIKETAQQASSVLAQKTDIAPAEEELAGEFFNTPVPMHNYYFAKRVVATFSAPWRGTPQTMKELEDLTWQELLLSFEAYRRGIEVSQEELETEIDKTLKADKVSFDWKEDRTAYEGWVKEKLNESVELFENQLRHLVQLRKLREEVIESIEPEVTEEEAYRKFLDEYNSLSVELVEFEDIEQAKVFYNEAKKSVPRNALDDLILDDAFFSLEASRRGITLSDEEKDIAVTLALREHNAFFRWKENPEKLQEWVDKNFAIDTELFKERVVLLATIDSLRQKIYGNQEPALDTEGRYEAFRQKNRNASRAYTQLFKTFVTGKDTALRFSSLKEAKDFYEALHRAPGYWEDQKRMQPKKFRRPGFVALDFLINVWGFARDDAYAMLDKPLGSYYPPAPIYKGYGVFKILDVRKAEKTKYEERKQYYFDRVKNIKKYQGFKDWLQQLNEDAHTTIFITSENTEQTQSQ